MSSGGPYGEVSGSSTRWEDTCMIVMGVGEVFEIQMVGSYCSIVAIVHMPKSGLCMRGAY